MIYRDKKGRFVSKEVYKQINKPLRDNKGRFVSKEVYKRINKKTVKETNFKEILPPYEITPIYESKAENKLVDDYKKETKKKQGLIDFIDDIIDEYDLDILYGVT